MEKITKMNCSKVLEKFEFHGDTSMEAAWRTVWHFCDQNGMKIDSRYKGIEMVIGFIEDFIKPK